MSDPLRIALVGATGLIGRTVMEVCVGRADVKLTAIARREVPLPKGARMEMFVADTDNWGEIIEAVKPNAIICALGSTWKKSGRDEEAFRAVDHDLVLRVARTALDHGVKRFVAVSSVGADPHAKSLYLRVKGETDKDLRNMRFDRLDILRPGLLVGKRKDDLRPGEKLGILASPLLNPLLQGTYRKFRGVKVETVARAAIAFAQRKARGRFAHENEAIIKMAASLPDLVE